MIDWPVFLDHATRQAFWTILVGICCNACCALLGCFLVLRRLAMLGDALSHAVLPGLVLAFIVTASTAPLPMFLGAAVFAMLTAGLSRLLTSLGHTTEESGLGIVFTAFFALGILLIQVFAENVHLDRDAVLEGSIEYVTLDTIMLAGLEWPTSLWVTGLVLLMVLCWLVLFWKEVKTATFDPGYASAIGLHGQKMLAALVILVAVCVVAAFKVVGSVLVVAMLVVPGATAQLLCQNLRNLLITSAVFAVAATVSGYLLARELNTSAAGMMAVMTGLGYLAALLFSPSQGLLFNRWQRREMQKRIHAEDILGMLYRLQERRGDTAVSPASPIWNQFAGVTGHEQVLRQLQKSELITQSETGIQLTDLGRRRGEQIIRGHRLWEKFLDHEFALPQDHLHEAANQMEHFLDQESRQTIEHRLGSPDLDPHGRTIPPGDDAGGSPNQ